MYREIKFRAWDKKTKKIRDVEEIYYDFLHKKDLNCQSGVCLKGVKHRSYNEVILTQYTGLKDKNGKEVYENDIVLDTLNKEIGEVKMNKFGRYSIYWKDWDRMNSYHGEAFNSWIYPDNTLEVKGNVFENPDLLTK